MLEKYNEIWDKASNTIKKRFDSDEKYLKTEIKSYKGKISTNFHIDKIPKEGSHCIWLSAILIDSVLKMGKSYYPQMF